MTVVLEAMGAALGELEVPVMFGLPGSGNYEFIHAARDAGVAYFGANHEAGAVGMTDGWSRVTGSPGLAMLSQGPGLTNGLTALTEAVKSHTPMVVAVVDAARSSRHGNLNIDQTAVVSALGAGVEVVRSPSSAVADLAWALQRCRTESRPIVLMIPLDLMHQDVPEAATPVVSYVSPTPMWPAPEAVTVAVTRIKAAKRPVILAGRGSVRAGAVDALRELAARTGALLVASAPAKGIFADDGFNLGISGSFASPIARELVGDADLLLAFGASLNAWTTGNGAMLRDEVPVVHVDVDPRAPGLHRGAALALIGDASVTARLLIKELGSWEQEGYRTSEVRDRIDRHDSATEFDATGDACQGLDPRVFTLELDAVLPHERTVTVDSGHFMGWPAKYLSAPDGAGFVYPQGFQSVGLGLAAAIGAAVARPERISVLTIGDGGSMLSPQELETAARHGLPLLVVVYNDSAYGAEVHRFAPIGLHVDLVQFPERDFAAIARSVGARGLTIEKLEDLGELGKWLASPSGPMVLDVKIDPAVMGDWVAGNSKAALA